MRIPESLFKDCPAAAAMLHLALEQLAGAYRLHGLDVPVWLDGIASTGAECAARHRSAACPAMEQAIWAVDIPRDAVQVVLAILHRTCLALAQQPGPPGARAAALHAFELLSGWVEPR